MIWKTIDQITDSERYGKTLRIFHLDYIDEDFNPEGIIEGMCIDNGPNEDDEWIGAVWNNEDFWETQTVVEPTHYIILEKPSV